MKAGFNRIEFARFARLGASLTRPGAASSFRRRLLWLPAALLVGGAVWGMMPASEGNVVRSETARLQLASIQVGPAAGDAATGLTAAEKAEVAELDRLRISSQTWRRGGLGSRALVTFTLRNDNDYAVRDVEISCAFSRRDGSHLTDRTRVLSDTVSMRSRKTFAHVHVGFVNVNAGQAKCSLVAARRV
jgi:hypothetical protein